MDAMKHPWRYAAVVGVVVGTTYGLLDGISGRSIQSTLLHATFTAMSWFLIWGFLGWRRARKR
ncbi:hypothetical protein NITHO_4580002 [Nitrolancea hollandica Lb]|uniref:Uncharacterized protein n=1 Tax=Nitrolancea hollandica Lb TaxID=1129897 RepID=I4EKE8_9BACT|nr:hypothetical protein NITHO_4580002 [Nitrolancea hollandica Lb]